MYPWKCPFCGRFMADSSGEGHARGGYAYWDEFRGICKVHGYQEGKTEGY